MFEVSIAFTSTYFLALTVDFSRTAAEVFLLLFGKRKINQIQNFSKKEVAIIIPCHNSEEVIENAVKTLPANYKIYCVANACSDSTEDIIKSLEKNHSNVKLLVSPKIGKIRAVLYGAFKARLEGFSHFLLLDDDIRWPADSQHISCYDKEYAVTALPVVPLNYDETDSLQNSFIRGMQAIEYHMMCISKAAQAKLGNVMMASGAAGIYRLDRFFECMAEHDGEHIGDDLQCCLIHHTKKYKIDFFESTIIQTEPPVTFSALWKQRAKRWELSPLLNWNWIARSIATGGVGNWLRLIISYRVFVLVNDVLILASLPVIFSLHNSSMYGLLTITYVSLALKLFIHHRFFKTYYVMNPTPFTFGRMLLYPFFQVFLWATRVYAIPFSFVKIYRYWFLGERKNSKLSLFINSMLVDNKGDRV